MKNKRQPNRRPFFRFVKCIVKAFRRKPRFVYLGEKPQNPCIYISNHSAASGPATYELFLPTAMRMWGTYEMCGNFKERWTYLNRVYFRRKKKRTKLMSFLLATFLTPFMALFYKGMRIIPTYPDARFMQSVRTSIDELENGVSILIYPENSIDGYHEVIKEIFGGFYTLANCYCTKTGKDVDIVNMYYDRKSRTVIVSPPQSYRALAQRFATTQEVLDFFLNDMNSMYYQYIVPTRKKRKKAKEAK